MTKIGTKSHCDQSLLSNDFVTRGIRSSEANITPLQPTTLTASAQDDTRRHQRKLITAKPANRDRDSSKSRAVELIKLQQGTF